VIRDPAELVVAVRRWIADDPDPETRDELEALLQADDRAELEDRFRGPLRFGTAGLRGKLGAGLHRMNRAVVIRSVSGVCAHLLAEVPDAARRGVTIGYDARHKSRVMAEDAAAVARAAGLAVHLFERPVPTPVVAFALLDRGAAAGLVVTASHNPPEYNGLKVYSGNGAQIVPPEDQRIAAAIERAPRVAKIPRAPLDPSDPGLVRLGEATIARYLDAVAALTRPGQGAPPPESVEAPLRIAYTALHGVGEEIVRRALERAGHADVRSVPSQRAPDPDFPTVEFPNPEEPAALAAVLELAREVDADLVLANDPDADRLAVAARHRGELHVLGGNRVGCLLAAYLLERDGGGPEALVVSSFVSSPMLGDVARAHGARWVQTLTGHKWIHNTAMRLEAEEGLRFVFGYEEALGYAAGMAVRDKDGISAAVLVAELARACKARGATLIDELARMAERYGSYESLQRAELIGGAGAEAILGERTRRARERAPSSLAGHAVRAVVDLEARTRRTADGRIEGVDLPRSDVLTFELEGGHRVMLRPSGTEPKLKLYADVRVAPGGDAASARALGERMLDELGAIVAG
jgi:phosphomannomutase